MKRKWCIVLLLCLVSLIWSSLSSKAQDIESLIKQLGEEDESVRDNAVGALGDIGEPAVLALIQALKSEDKGVQHQAALALGSIGEPAKKAVPVLIEALRDENGATRVHAASALAQIDNSKRDMVVSILIKALGDETG